MRLFLFAILSLITLSSFGQQKSGLLSYHTAYEKTIFEAKVPEHLDMFMCIGSKASDKRTSEAREQLNSFIQEIKSANVLRLSEAKLIKELHKRVHERFLTTYRLDAQFYEIFETGQYNCVSSTALFGLILEKLEIPFYVQEQPTHVFIMAYPNTKSISVEMTASRDASWLPKKKDVYKSVRILQEYGLTTQEEISKLGENGVYNKFYNTNRPLTIVELAGIQYMNQSVKAIDTENYQEALNSVCKAEQWFKDDKVQLSKAELLYYLIHDSKISSLNDLRNLLIYAELPKSDDERVFYEFVVFLDNQLIKKGKKELADSCFHLIDESALKVELKKRLIGYYYMGLSEYYGQSYNSSKSLQYAEESYKILPDDNQIKSEFVRNIINETLRNNYASESEEEDEFDHDDFDKFNNYLLKYPELKEHNLIRVGLIMIYTTFGIDAYSENDGDEGDKYFNEVMSGYNKLDDRDLVDMNYIGWIYAEKGSYLYRQHKYEEALKVLEEGLTLVPEHERLLARIEIVKSKLGK